MLVVWSPRANRDLQDIWRHFARAATREIADRLLRDIAATAHRVSERPLIGRPREELLVGLRSIRVAPYTVFYRVADRRIEIVRVLHERRNLVSAFRMEND